MDCKMWLSEIWNVHWDGGWMNKEQYPGGSDSVRKEININTVNRWDCRIALGGCIWSRMKLDLEVELEIFHQKGINWREGVTEALIQVTSQFWIVDMQSTLTLNIYSSTAGYGQFQGNWSEGSWPESMWNLYWESGYQIYCHVENMISTDYTWLSQQSWHYLWAMRNLVGDIQFNCREVHLKLSQHWKDNWKL